ncbi:sulfopropanediol 3-dehydrogenase [Bogoriella caseilytica]|uniref:Histidinol dehydrogenase n=1 Tax=Bogoriella caseilytica TaxID=56055 RepID=A0A3N2B9R4_9MICO|nr:sulfopropanediol 3-dehydrogenase [Bogoriella caseilytica]
MAWDLKSGPGPTGRVEPEPGVSETVARVIADVRARGDDAVIEYARQFDGTVDSDLRLTASKIEEIVDGVPVEVRADIATVQRNVRDFAERQLESMKAFEAEVAPGVVLGQRHTPIEAVGAYVPGGRYPLLATAHMTIVTARVAGVPRVAACTPPIRGEVPAATIAAMSMAGADEIYLLGGVQAVAALAIGTETIPSVDLLAGPGNAYVAEAKRQLFGDVGIDLTAGPTETLIIADDTADARIVAVDLLSQAEHGPDSPAVLITTSEQLGLRVLELIDRLLPGMSTRELAGPAWRDHGAVHVVPDLAEAYALADEYASEHVQILTAEPRDALERMQHYGALFLGEGTCVSYGDKVIGTNHVLPTRGAARYTGGLWVGKYLRTTTYQEVTDRSASAALGELCGRAARAESFEGHARSGDLRAALWGNAEPTWMEGL